MSLAASLAAQLGRLSLDVALDTGAGTLALVGPNGAGKSSVLRLLVGSLALTRGRVAVSGDVLLDTDARVDVPLERRRLGYVPQDYALFPHLTVRQNVAFPGAGEARVGELLRELGLEALAGRRPPSLSGGERQRVALARALAVSPRALLLDEPLAALDVHARHEVRTFLAGWLQRVALPTVLVTHDATDAQVLAQRLVVLEAGRVVQVGTWAELVARPATKFVEAFVTPR
jgi:molybdate transport system ATP-binding protein